MLSYLKMSSISPKLDFISINSVRVKSHGNQKALSGLKPTVDFK